MRRHAVLFSGLLFACSGEILSHRPPGGPGASLAKPGATGRPGEALLPLTAEMAPPRALRRLSAREYDNALALLLDDHSGEGALTLPEDVRLPFDNAAASQVPSAALVESLEFLARAHVDRLLKDVPRRDRVVGCAPQSPGDATCFAAFVSRFGRLALRRPLSPAEHQAFSGFLRYAEEDGDPYSCLEYALLAFLQHPDFVYRAEIGRPTAEPNLLELDGFELVSNIAFTVWGGPPDDFLLELAATGELTDDAGLLVALDWALAAPQAQAAAVRFHTQWLGNERLAFSGPLASAMQNETEALIRSVLFEHQRPWQDLFRSDETYVDASLAEVYGLPSPGAGAAWVKYGALPRRGILSHGAYLSLGGKFDDTSPTRRGRAVRTRLLCQDIPPPPPELNPDEPPAADPTLCKEDRYRQVHAKGNCAGCHSMMDPIGFGLERFDALGRYRETEPAKPSCVIKGEGEVVGIGAFNGPAQLSALLVESGQLGQCATEQMYRFAFGRGQLGAQDRAAARAIAQRLGGGAADFRFDELVKQTVTSPTFRFRRATP